MSEYRKDPIVDRWVIIAPERSQRPVHQTRAAGTAESHDPFSEGHEAETTPEILAFRSENSQPNGPGWQVRVVPNMYPAVFPADTRDTISQGIFESMSGVGAHELIIECPHDEANMSRLGHANIVSVLLAYRERLRALKVMPHLSHAVIFKNKGTRAGASVLHSHSQLLATPFVPPLIADELAGALRFFEATGENIFERIVRHETADGSRVVVDAPRLLAVCPYASRFSYESWIIPRESGSHFENASDATIDALATVLRSILRKLDIALDDPDYNFVIHSAPLQSGELPHYRWHLEIYPRLSGLAGYECGAGCFVNQVTPEAAAQRLRSTAAD